MFAAGCQSLGTDARGEFGTADLAEPLTAEQSAFAEALAHFAIAQSAEARRDFEGALAAYERARQADPEHLPIYMRMAINLLRQNEGEAAAALLRDLAERHPDKVQPLIWLGSVYRQKQELDQALATYTMALAIAPTETALYLTTTDLLFQLGREAEGLERLQAGIDAGARPGPLRRVRGEVFSRRATTATESDARRKWRAKAVADFEAALTEAPYDTGLLASLGELYMRAGNLEAAISYYERLLRRDPTDSLTLERLAQAYERTGQWSEATATLEQLAKLQPTNARVFLALGALYEALEETTKAIVNYQLASRADPTEPAAYLKLGMLKMEDAPQAAIATLETGLEYNPENPQLWEMLAYLQFNEAHYPEAIVAFRAAERYSQAATDRPVTMTPNFYLYLALAYYFDRQAEAVPAVLGQALKKNPDAVEAFAHFVFTDEEDDRARQAVPILNALHAEQPEQWAILTMLGYMHSFLKEYEKALDVLGRVYAGVQGRDDVDDILTARFLFWYAAANERNERYERAEELFYQSLERDPDNAETYNYLAYMWAENDMKLDLAKTYVLRALEDRPDSGAFIDTLGWIYYKKGRYEDAYREIRRALELLPDDPEILDHLGDIYHALDKPDKAIAKWKRVFEIDPEKGSVASKLLAHDVDVDALKEPPDDPPPEQVAPEEIERHESDVDKKPTEEAPSNNLQTEPVPEESVTTDEPDYRETDTP